MGFTAAPSGRHQQAREKAAAITKAFERANVILGGPEPIEVRVTSPDVIRYENSSSLEEKGSILEALSRVEGERDDLEKELTALRGKMDAKMIAQDKGLSEATRKQDEERKAVRREEEKKNTILEERNVVLELRILELEKVVDGLEREAEKKETEHDVALGLERRKGEELLEETCLRMEQESNEKLKKEPAEHNEKFQNKLKIIRGKMDLEIQSVRLLCACRELKFSQRRITYQNNRVHKRKCFQVMSRNGI